MIWRIIVWLCGVGSALRIAAFIDRLPRPAGQPRGCIGRSCGGGCEAATREDAPAHDQPQGSQIFAPAGMFAMVRDPKPLHPRAIDGEELHVRPQLPLRTDVELAIVFAMGQREAAYRRWGWRSS